MTDGRPADAPHRSLLRDRTTLALGAAYVFVGLASGSLGQITSELRHELKLSGVVTGLHGSMFGWSLLLLALSARWLTGIVRDERVFVVAVGAMAAGALTLTLGRYVAVTLAGVVALGLGAAALVVVTPRIVAEHHDAPSARDGAYLLINALSIVGSIVGPLVLAATLRFGWGWRLPFALTATVVAALTMVTARRARLIVDHGSHGADVATTRRATVSAVTLLRRLPAVRRRWSALVVGISIEFAAILWGSTAMQELAGASASAGALAIGLLSAGMAIGRFAGANVVGRWPAATTLRWSFAAAVVAFVPVRYGPGVATRALGMFALGLVISMIYPMAFARLYEVEAMPRAAVAAVGALASGTAISLAPAALGAVADAAGLGRALYIIPAFALAGIVLVGKATDREPRPATHS